MRVFLCSLIVNYTLKYVIDPSRISNPCTTLDLIMQFSGQSLHLRALLTGAHPQVLSYYSRQQDLWGDRHLGYITPHWSSALPRSLDRPPKLNFVYNLLCVYFSYLVPLFIRLGYQSLTTTRNLSDNYKFLHIFNTYLNKLHLGEYVLHLLKAAMHKHYSWAPLLLPWIHMLHLQLLNH
jgi:hypothetical protein